MVTRHDIRDLNMMIEGVGTTLLMTHVQTPVAIGAVPRILDMDKDNLLPRPLHVWIAMVNLGLILTETNIDDIQCPLMVTPGHNLVPLEVVVVRIPIVPSLVAIEVHHMDILRNIFLPSHFLVSRQWRMLQR